MLLNNAFWFSGQGIPVLGSGLVVTTQKDGGQNPTTGFYNLASNTFTINSSLGNPAGATSNPAGTGNASTGLSIGGVSVSGTYLKNVSKFDYTSSTWSAGSSVASSAGTHVASASSSSTKAYNYGGQPNSSTTNGTTFVATYTYAGDVAGSGTALPTAGYDGAATGTATMGMMAAGFQGLNTVYKYTYANDGVATGTNLTYSSVAPSAFGNQQIGMVCGGGTYNVSTVYNSTSVYTYSSDTTASGVTLSYAMFSAMAASTNKGGVIIGGRKTNSSPYQTTLIYVFGSASTVGGANLGSGPEISAINGCCFCSTPGYLT